MRGCTRSAVTSVSGIAALLLCLLYGLRLVEDKMELPDVVERSVVLAGRRHRLLDP